MKNTTLQQKKSSPTTNLELGWVIYSGASAHMTPFRADCRNINHTYKQIFLADDPSILYNQMGVIDIPIKSQNREIEKLVLKDVLIVPNLDSRLFSVSSFLSKGNNWVNFKRDHIELGVRNGPTIKLPITSLQSNAFVVDHNTSKTKPKHYTNNNANTHMHSTDRVVGHQK